MRPEEYEFKQMLTTLRDLCRPGIEGDTLTVIGNILWQNGYKLVQRKGYENVVHCKDCGWAEIHYYKGEPYYSCGCEDGLARDVPSDGFCYEGYEKDK